MKRLFAVFFSLFAVAAITVVAQHPVADPNHKNVPKVDYGAGPRAPSIDNYYLEGDPATFIPDEFMSNPGGEVDPTKLKGYHLPPILRWIKIKGKKTIKAGESVQFEAQAESPVTIQRWFLAYQGPSGRKSALRATFNPRKDNPWMHDGVLNTTKWQEPGIYVVYDGELNSELGHSKAYFAPMHPAVIGLEVEVLPNPDVDITDPTLEGIWIGETEKPENGKVFGINDMIPVRAVAKDEKSGVSDMTLRMSGPDNKYVEVKLNPYFARPGEFVGYFKINPWSVGGEYIARTLTVGDRAGNKKEVFAPTNDKLKAVKFSVTQDPKKVDKVLPRLISVAFDKSTAKLGDEIKISAIAVDDMSGVGDVYVDVASSPSMIDKKRIKLTQRAKPPLIKPGFDIEEYAWEGSFKPHALDEPGDWIVTRVFIRDKASNYTDIRSTEHSDLSSVKVVFADPSGSAPAPAPTSSGPAPGPGNPLPIEGQQKLRRVDMTPPHPPRGPCLNCHEP